MEDKSLFNSNQPQTISEGLQNFIDAMVEEIVIEGKPFDTQKKYLKKFSENEGLDYDKLEADITTFIEILESLRVAFTKVQVKLAEEKGRECHISDETVKKLVSHSLPKEPLGEERPAQVSSEPKDKHKSKIGLWITLAVVLIVAFVFSVSYLRQKAETKMYESCQSVQDYRKYINQYGAKGNYYNEANLFVSKYEADSAYKAEIEAKRMAMQDVPLFLFDYYYRQYDENHKMIDQESRYGWIDAKGEVAIQPDYSGARDFSEELAAVKKGNKWGYIDKLGLFVIDTLFEQARDFSSGLAVVKKNGLYGVIDKQGSFVIEPQYEEMQSRFSENLVGVKIDGKWGVIDITGAMVINPKFSKIEYYGYSDGLMGVEINGKWGFVDKKGNMSINPQYDDIKSFSEGLAAVCVNSKWGFVDKFGTIILKPQFLDVRSFSEGYAAVSNTANGWENIYYLIDRSGKRLLNSKSTGYAPSFSEGLAYVREQGYNLDNNRYIDHNGNTVLELGFKYEHRPFRNGIAKISNANGTWSYIDKKGKPVFTTGWDWYYQE